MGNRYRLCVLEYLNGRVRNMMMTSITSGFGVLGENNGRKVIDFSA